MQIVTPTILPFTVERENLLLDALVAVQRGLPHSNAYFRVSHAKSSQKEHTLWVTLVINRQAFKHGANHLTYKQVSIGNPRGHLSMALASAPTSRKALGTSGRRHEAAGIKLSLDWVEC